MNASYRARLLAGAAAATAIISAAPVMAQSCEVDSDSVECEADVEASEINEALGELSGPSGVLEIGEDVLVTADVSEIEPQTPPVTGNMSIANNGVIGSEADPLDIVFQPPEGTPDVGSSFDFANYGAMYGDVDVVVDLAASFGLTGLQVGSVSLESRYGDLSAVIAGDLILTDDAEDEGVLAMSTALGVATVRTLEGANIGGDVAVLAGDDVALINSGTISGDVEMQAGIQSIETEQLVTVETTVLDDGTEQTDQVETVTNRSSYTRGEAGVLNGVTGVISGDVELRGSDGVRLRNAGLIDGAVVLNSANQEFYEEDVNLIRTARSPGGGETFSFIGVSNEARSTNVGGDITATIAPGGAITGGLTAITNRGAVNMLIDGRIGEPEAGGDLTVIASGIETYELTRIDPDDGSTFEQVEQTATGGRADVTIGPDGSVYGNASVEALGGIGFYSQGLVAGNLQLTSLALPNSSSMATATSEAEVDGGSQTVETRTTTFETAVAGGAIEAAIGDGGAVLGDISANSALGIAFDLDGMALGDIDLTSQANAQTDETIRTVTTTRTPVDGEDDRVVSVATETRLTENTPVGGSVTGRYYGIVGAPEEDENARDIAVTQIAAGESSATIGGTIYGSFEGRAEAIASTIARSGTLERSLGGGLPASRRSETEEVTTVTHLVADSSVFLTGAVLSNGEADGNVEVIASRGTASLQIEGGRVGGSVAVAGGNGTDGQETATLVELSQDTEAGDLQPISRTEITAETNALAGGTANLTLTGGTIDGDAVVLGFGSGEGTVGAYVALDAQSMIGGVLGISNAEEQEDAFDTLERTSDTRVRGPDGAVSRTVVEVEENTPSALAGDVVAEIDGSIGGLQARAFFGDVSVTLGGTSNGDITIASGATAANRTVTTAYTGSDPESLDAEARQSRSETQQVSTYGGIAALTIAAPSGQQEGAEATAAIQQGNIRLAGAEASILTVEAGARVLPGGGLIAVGEALPEPEDTGDEGEPDEGGGTAEGSGSGDGETETTGNETVSGNEEEGVEVVTTRNSVTDTLEQSSSTSISPSGNFSNFTESVVSIEETYTADNEVATNTTTFTQVRRTNIARFFNNGLVGSDQAAVTINVTGVGAEGESTRETATIENGGAIFGDITLRAIGSQGSGRLFSDNTGEETVSELSFTRTALASAARLDNAGLINGSVAVQAGTGTVANRGIMRGEVNLGAAAANEVTISIDQEALDALSEAADDTPPGMEEIRALLTTELGPDLLQQTYSFAQDGLLVGNIRIGELETIGLAGFLPEGTRTSQIGANIALGDNSITLGAIAGETGTSAGEGAPERLTSTIVTLTGSGFFGVGNDLTPAEGDYLFAPDFAPYVAFDPSLLDDFDTLASGARVSGVERIERAGTGTFTIVAASVAEGDYAFDIGSFDIQSGDVQLGVAGSGVFRLRGDVSNDGGLWLGRTVGHAGGGATIDGIAFSVTGNYRQGADGRLYVPINATIATAPASTAARLDVSGDASLAGQIALLNQPGIYFGGERVDFLSVGGIYSDEGLEVDPAHESPFLDYRLTTALEGDATLVGIEVIRTPYASAATNANERAVAEAFQGALASLQSAPAIAEGTRLAALRDSVIALDFGSTDIATQFGAVGSAAAYGSILNLSALDAFNPLGRGGLGAGIGASPVAQRRAGGGARGAAIRQSRAIDRSGAPWSSLGGESGEGTRVTAWAMPSFGSQTLEADPVLGTSQLESDHFGIVGGFELTSEGERRIGFGFGYDGLDATASGYGAQADSLVLGAYLAQRLGPVLASAQVAYAWTDWDVDRGPSSASFASNELRVSGDLGYDLAFGDAAFGPFAAFTWRVIDVDGFTETGGPTPLTIAEQEDSVFSPELGLRFAYTGSTVRPFASASYVFQGEIDTPVTASFVALPDATFALQGTQPEDYTRLTGGVAFDLGFGELTLRGDALLGEDREALDFAGGLRIPF
ncbi:autotransporter outer membrane beta-barrel domain-containing protein [Citromicrobium bathyomarinum]|uniref:autotransporter outer membrane beta-barrel domain-containing protein n=1 Tax=Citromicrobium bathyomarinum TaxID=72174 RepID=UPI00315AA819